MLGYLENNTESVIKFAALEKWRKEEMKILMWFTC